MPRQLLVKSKPVFPAGHLFQQLAHGLLLPEDHARVLRIVFEKRQTAHIVGQAPLPVARLQLLKQPPIRVLAVQEIFPGKVREVSPLHHAVSALLQILF